MGSVVVFLLRYTAICLAFSTGSIVSANEPPYEFQFVCSAGDKDSPNGRSSRLFAERVAERSNGRIKINVFYQNELGGQNEIFDHLLKGNVHLMLEWPMTAYDQRLAIGFAPYLVLSWEDAFQAFSEDGWLTELMTPIFAENGLKFFGPYPVGFGGIATRGRYATNRADARGIKVRSQTIFPLPQTVQTMGFDAIPLDWSEVYTSIQTGVVDGDSGNVIYWAYEYFGDILDYYVHAKQIFTFNVLTMNRDAWMTMDAEHQAIVSEAARFIIDKHFIDARKEDEYWIKEAQANGMQYIVPSEAEMREWITEVRAEVWPLVAKTYGQEMMETIRQKASKPN